MSIDEHDSKKYVVVATGTLLDQPTTVEQLVKAINDNPSIVQFGGPGSQDEFLVLKLSDIHSGPALEAYARSAMHTDVVLGAAVSELVSRAGVNHPLNKKRD